MIYCTKVVDLKQILGTFTFYVHTVCSRYDGNVSDVLRNFLYKSTRRKMHTEFFL